MPELKLIRCIRAQGFKIELHEYGRTMRAFALKAIYWPPEHGGSLRNYNTVATVDAPTIADIVRKLCLKLPQIDATQLSRKLNGETGTRRHLKNGRCPRQKRTLIRNDSLFEHLIAEGWTACALPPLKRMTGLQTASDQIIDPRTGMALYRERNRASAEMLAISDVLDSCWQHSRDDWLIFVPESSPEYGPMVVENAIAAFAMAQMQSRSSSRTTRLI